MSDLFKNFTEPESFEEGLKRLEGVVERLEAGEESLADMLELFKEGSWLARWCYSKLEKVEEEVKILTENEGVFELKPFRPPSNTSQ